MNGTERLVRRMYVRSGKAPATLADVKVGMRIVLHLVGKEDSPTVREVRLTEKK